MQQIPGQPAVTAGGDLVSLVLEELCHRPTDVDVVIDQQDAPARPASPLRVQ